MILSFQRFVADSLRLRARTQGVDGEHLAISTVDALAHSVLSSFRPDQATEVRTLSAYFRLLLQSIDDDECGAGVLVVDGKDVKMVTAAELSEVIGTVDMTFVDEAQDLKQIAVRHRSHVDHEDRIVADDGR